MTNNIPESKCLTIRFSEEQIERIKKAAEDQVLSVSSLIRQAVIQKVREVEDKAKN